MLPEDKIAELKQKHGDVWEIEGLIVPVVFKRPKPAEAERFAVSGNDEKKRMGAAKELCSRVVVHPELAEWNKLTEEWPLLPFKVAGEVAEVMSGQAQTDAKKL